MRSFISTPSVIIRGIVLGLGCFAGIVNAANLSDKNIGISIDLDDELVEQSLRFGYRVFSVPDNSMAVFIKPVHDLSLYDMKQDIQLGSWKDGAVKLDVTGKQKTELSGEGSSLMVPVRGHFGEHKIRGVLGGYTGTGDQKFVVIGAARPDYYSDWKERIKAMFESIQYIEIDHSEMLANWHDRIAGKSLVPLNPNIPDFPELKTINLCSNGTVADESSANTRNTATVRQQPVWNGYTWVTMPVVAMPPPPDRWRIVPLRGYPTLVVHHGPEPLEIRLLMDGDQLLLNGVPYNISENTLCR